MMFDDRFPRDADRPTKSSADASPLLLGRFRVEAALGTGGFGQVVKAYDTRNKRYVAIKTLKRSLASADPTHFDRLKERFMREVETNASVGVHSNIVTVFDQASDSGGTLYLILEYLSMGTLADRLGEGALPLAEALHVTADVAKGLRVAHRRDIVHRDVKPANIFLSDEGHAKIGDFGIAQLGTLSGRTQMGDTHPHTPLYASPEQEGSTAYLSPATDQYSLGLVLFEMLTGEKYKQVEPRQREVRVRGLPAPIGALVERMTARSVEDRYPSMDAVVGAIAAIEPVLDLVVAEGEGEMRGETVPVQHQGRIEREPISPGPPRRIGRRALLAGIGAVALAGGVAGGALAVGRGDSGGRATVTAAAGVAAARATTIAPAAGTLHVLAEHTAGVYGVAFAPDGRTLASASGDMTTRVWRVGDGTVEQTLTEQRSGLRSVAFSPDGQRLASGSSEPRVILWRANDGYPLRNIDGQTGSVHALAFAPDGQILASASSDPGVILSRVSDGAVLRTFEDHTDLPFGSVAFSPDGQMLAYPSGDSVQLVRVSDGVLMRTLDGHTQAVNGVAFSPNGRMVASASDDTTVKVWRVSDGAIMQTLEGPRGHTEAVNAVAFDPAGDVLASGSTDMTVKVWRVSDGTVARTFAGHTDVVTSVAFNNTGEILASASYDTTIRLWQAR